MSNADRQKAYRDRKRNAPAVMERRVVDETPSREPPNTTDADWDEPWQRHTDLIGPDVCVRDPESQPIGAITQKPATRSTRPVSTRRQGRGGP